MTSEKPTSLETKSPDGGHDDLASARRVLKLEAEALEMLAQSLGDELVAAVDLLYGATGRVIVSGMGKSGHIGRKIAATMASTGTPASYVHPGEASHGDLGMITPDDAVLVLSNSGNTPELGDIVAYTRRYRIPLIAIVGRDSSTLGNAADVALVLPPAPEACPMGLAPTTSTTLALALGDALSVALLERKGFSPDQFQVLHPGGQLGKSLVKVEDIMHKGNSVPLAGPDIKMSDIIIEMSSKSFGCVGIVDNGELIGVITDGDLRRHMSGDMLSMPARDVMTASPKTIRLGALAAEAVGLMNEKNITSLFVANAGTDAINDDRQMVAGIIHLHDCLRAGII
jgi:arabinose-5-phosphate isomerase